MEARRKVSYMKGRETKNLNGRIPADEHARFEAEAEQKGVSISEHLRNVVMDRNKYQQQMEAVAGAIESGNAELSEVVSITVRAEIRALRATLLDEIGELKARGASFARALVDFNPAEPPQV